MAERKKQKGGEPVDGIFERATITAGSASIAGSGSAWITTPIDVVKTRIMLAASTENAEASSQSQTTRQTPEVARAARKSGWLVAKEVFKNEGTKGLFRGALLRSIWTAMGSGLYLGCYEGGRFYLEDQRKAAGLNEGDSIMEKEWKDVKVGIGKSRSQDVVKKSAWQDE